MGITWIDLLDIELDGVGFSVGVKRLPEYRVGHALVSDTAASRHLVVPSRSHQSACVYIDSPGDHGTHAACEINGGPDLARILPLCSIRVNTKTSCSLGCAIDDRNALI